MSDSTTHAASTGSLRLTVIPSVTAGLLPDGKLSLTQKFVSGSDFYSKLWPGTVTVLLKSGPIGDNLDNVAWALDELPFRVIVDGDLRNQIANSDMVLASATREQAQIAAMCSEVGVPIIYVTEYSLRTRLQIVCTNTRNPLLRLRRAFWEYRTERMLRRAVSQSDGVQCNGTPTFEAYRALNRGPLLFFDTRSAEDSVLTNEGLAVRLKTLERGQPLRLVFSGRLIRMKGADHLIDVARHLTRLGFPFQMTICGDGELAGDMGRQIGNLPIVMAGVLDFERELQPLLKNSTDLFVCCHRQGDPSCTYLETMAAGVPIVGYDNEAFIGVRAASGAGWTVPMNRPEAMAAKIASLTRSEIAAASRRSLEFARQHTFESTFGARVVHMASLARAPA